MGAFERNCVDDSMVRADAMRCEVDALAIGLTLEHYKAQAHGQAVEEG